MVLNVGAIVHSQVFITVSSKIRGMLITQYSKIHNDLEETIRLCIVLLQNSKDQTKTFGALLCFSSIAVLKHTLMLNGAKNDLMGQGKK